MKIVCPSCAATYEVPESAVASKRTVRCARCGADWVPGATEEPPPAPPTEETVAAPAPEAPEPAPVAEEGLDSEQLAEPALAQAAPPATLAADQWQSVAAAIAAEAAAKPPAAPTPKAPIAAWFVSVALLAILAASWVAFRAPIMKAWPPSTRLYAVLGLYHP